MVRACLWVLALTVLGCGGRSSSEPGDTSSGGSAGTTSSGGTAGTTSSGGSAGTTSSGGSAASECVPKPEGAGGFVEPSCADLSVLTVSDPLVLDASGDGIVSAGEAATIQAKLNEVAGEGFSWYPGVRFDSDDPGVSVKEDDWFYAIFACQSHGVSAHASFDASIPPGTSVMITARVGMINTDCPDAYAIQIPITVH